MSKSEHSRIEHAKMDEKSIPSKKEMSALAGS